MTGLSIAREARPPSGPMPKIQLPRFERATLENGLAVRSVRHGNLPEVSVRFVFPYGAADDRAERSGTAMMVARALTEGTEDRSAPEVAEALDRLGSRFRIEVSHDATILSPYFLSHVQDGTFPLLAEIVTRPAFESNEVERLRDERLDEIVGSLDEPSNVASLRISQVSFGSHPYATRTGGVEETVRAIEVDDLRAFHAGFYRPAGATLILVGDVSERDRLRDQLEVAFKGWEGECSSSRFSDDPAPPERSRIWAVDWPGPQSEIRIGHVGISRLDPDYPAVMVMNAILGGLFSSRINMNLREDKGWTYGAQSRFDARRKPGPFQAGAAVEAKATVGAVSEILAEMGRMRTDPPSDDELELAKNALTLSMPRLFETIGQISTRVAQQTLYNLPDDYWETYPDVVRAVSREDVERVAEAHLWPEHAGVVVVGPVDLFKKDLEAMGTVELRDVRGRPA